MREELYRRLRETGKPIYSATDIIELIRKDNEFDSKDTQYVEPRPDENLVKRCRQITTAISYYPVNGC